jgi:hypothetical protein
MADPGDLKLDHEHITKALRAYGQLNKRRLGLSLESASTIAALRGDDYEVQKIPFAFCDEAYCVVNIKLKPNGGKGRLPKKVLVKTLNALAARNPRPKTWHDAANRYVSYLSDDELVRHKYDTLARDIKDTIDANTKVIKKPTLSSIKDWLKTGLSADVSVEKFRKMRAKAK